MTEHREPSEYAKQVLRFCRELFPPERQQAFADTAQASIDAGTNYCVAPHKEPVKTTGMLYPDGVWVCKECKQMMFQMGVLGNGKAVFDMADRPEGWKA